MHQLPPTKYELITKTGNSSRKRHSIVKRRQSWHPSAVRNRRSEGSRNIIIDRLQTYNTCILSPDVRAQPRLRGDTRHAAGGSHVLMQVYLTCIWFS
jgi:hypothetical protein